MYGCHQNNLTSILCRAKQDYSPSRTQRDVSLLQREIQAQLGVRSYPVILIYLAALYARLRWLEVQRLVEYSPANVTHPLAHMLPDHSSVTKHTSQISRLHHYRNSAQHSHHPLKVARLTSHLSHNTHSLHLPISSHMHSMNRAWLLRSQMARLPCTTLSLCSIPHRSVHCTSSPVQQVHPSAS